ncbi:MAG: polyphosphate kinase 1 [Rhizobacter sp.]|nr:polyphosphate kinase 1 [Chlorobiales bacterium]
MAVARLIDRDLSWLSFNERVLQEAAGPDVPLYERLRFLAIYSSNLDEFFRVRVASLKGLGALRRKTQLKLGIDTERLLKKISETVERQQDVFGKVFRNELVPALAAKNIFLVRETDLTPDEEIFVRAYFRNEIRPHLSPVFIDPQTTGAPPFLQNKSLYFAVRLLSKSGLAPPDTRGKINPGKEFPFAEQPLAEEKVALLEIPTAVLPRFIVLPGGREAALRVIFLDDALRFCLADAFDMFIVAGVYSVKLTRDAELYIDDEFSGDLIAKIKKGLSKRKTGVPSRFLYDEAMPREMLRGLGEALHLSKEDLIRGSRYHNFSDFFTFPLPPASNAGLVYESLEPLAHHALDAEASMFDAITKGDAMLCYPYHRFEYVIRLLREAASDPDVTSIHITLYRVSSASEVIGALVAARRNGKRVTAFIEVKARFDEETNLGFAEELRKAGATVLYSLPGLKVHAKLCLITRRETTREPEGEAHYAYLATGNFNEKTARIYTDFGLMTKDPRLTRDVARVFETLEAGEINAALQPNFQHLFVAPFDLRQKFLALIDREIAHAEAGREAGLILKMNSLEDEAMIEKLYDASAAGVKVRLIVRGMQRLRAGVKELSERIEAVSIVDRFLEHGRVYMFANGGDEEMYLASADWMTRNLSRRIETAFPVYDATLRKQIGRLINLQLADNVKSRVLGKSQKNKYRKRDVSQPECRSQLAIYDFLKNDTA